jgi:rhodanese-related sulfurtransferase/predicted small lipoprotein YifL
MMLKKILTPSIVLMSIALAVTGCGQTTPINNPTELPPADQFEIIRKAADNYLSSNRVGSISPDQLHKEYVQNKNPNYYPVDIRANTDFVASNVRGSVNIPYAQTVNLNKLENLPKDKTLVIIDYNGHWAAQTAATWNMMGYNAVPLHFGVQSWTNEAGPAGYEKFPEKPLGFELIDEMKMLGEFELPELKMPEGKTEEMIRLLSGTYLYRNYKGFIDAEQLAADLENEVDEYYLVDIREPELYKKGHIKGAVNIPLQELAKVEMLKYLPLDKKIVLIGLDGMDASQGARVLVTLGYHAVSLKYGVSYWSGNKELTGIEPIHNLVKEQYELTPLNYTTPSAGPAGCG